MTNVVWDRAQGRVDNGTVEICCAQNWEKKSSCDGGEGGEIHACRKSGVTFFLEVLRGRRGPCLARAVTASQAGFVGFA